MIRWPWVSRADYDAACREIGGLENRVQEWRSHSDAWKKLYEDQKALVVELLQIAKPKALVPPPSPAPEREPSIVAQVIREQSGGDPRLAAHLRTYAGKLKREGNSPEEIAFALGQWISTEPDISVT